MEFFTKEELEVFKESANLKCDKKNNESHKIAYDKLAFLYAKVEYWANQMRKIYFPEGKVHAFKRPTTQWNKFEIYQWAKIYPTAEDYKNKWLAYTVGFSTDNYFDIKIDTVGLKDKKKADSELRQKYENYRGVYNNSEIVKRFSFEEVLSGSWDDLFLKTKLAIKSIEKHFDKIKVFNAKDNNRMPSFPIKTLSSKSLNTILFGPPGTGKTYKTKSLALEIIDGQVSSLRKEVNQRYSKLVDEGFVKFVTFHQSMTYEDFVEGIKPVMENDEEDKLQYTIEPGIFKEICSNASEEFLKSKLVDKTSSKTLTFNFIFTELLDSYQQKIDDGQEIKIKSKTGNDIFVEKVTTQGNFKLSHKDGKRSYTVSKNRLEKLYNRIDDFEQIPNIYSYFREIIGGNNASAYWAILNQINEKEKVFRERETNSKLQNARNYVLIIDEINRGNVSAILGELITLLEEDKRLGNRESLKVELPYSKSSFSVPPNLYIIGTMNTADRSVEALDTALRRRFTFEEVKPNPALLSPKSMIVNLWNIDAYAALDWDESSFAEHAEILYSFLGIENENAESEAIKMENTRHKLDWSIDDLNYLSADNFSGINLEQLLKTINGRIRKLLNKDYQIGHAFFINVFESESPLKELRIIFNNKILPLLQEYFYGSFGKIQLVLGSAFVEAEKENDFPFAEAGGEEYEEKIVYQIVDVSDEEKINDEDFKTALIKIYNPSYERATND